MANFPGALITPGLHGPASYLVVKTEAGYYIEKVYSNTTFEGTPRDIAKQIIMDWSLKPETGIRLNYVGPFHINWKRDPICILCQTPVPSPSDLDLNQLTKDISKELSALKTLIPFL